MKRFISLVMVAVLLPVLAGCGFDVCVLPTESPTTSAPTTAPTTVPTTAATTEVTEAPATEPAVSYVEVFREGERSLIPVEIARGTVGDYTIAFDPEYFTFIPQETVDMFHYSGWEGPQAVYFCVSDYDDSATAQQFIDSTLTQFADSYESCATEQTTVGGYDTTAVYLSCCKDAPDYQTHLFLTNCQGNLYLIACNFTFEMYEGLYAIMLACFDTLTPVRE